MVFDSAVEALEAARSIMEDDKNDQDENEALQKWLDATPGTDTEKHVLEILREAVTLVKDGLWW